MLQKEFPYSLTLPATTLADVILQLEEIIAWARQAESRLGLFAALCRRNCLRVQQALGSGGIADVRSTEAVMVNLVRRYVDALHRHLTDQLPTACWVQSFEAADCWRPEVLQHLLLGLHAHINLDLGVAVAEEVPEAALADWQPDFWRLHELLAAELATVQQSLASAWPLLGLASRYLGTGEQELIHFSLQRAMSAAWELATQLAPHSPRSRLYIIDDRDWSAAELAKQIRAPGLRLSAVLLEARAGEPASIASQIAALG